MLNYSCGVNHFQDQAACIVQADDFCLKLRVFLNVKTKKYPSVKNVCQAFIAFQKQMFIFG
jgi:hypothetical protein